MIPHYLNPRDPIFHTYTWAERGRRLRDDACLWLAHRLPRRLRYWVIIDTWGAATSGEKGNVGPWDIGVGELLDEVDVEP